MHECISIFLHSWESMEVLNKVFSGFHHTFSFFAFPEEITMFLHNIEYFSENWFIAPRKKTPRITKTCSTNHKSIKILESFRMYHLCNTIVIREYITIGDYWYLNMLFEIVDARKISFSRECLLVGTTMN